MEKTAKLLDTYKANLATVEGEISRLLEMKLRLLGAIEACSEALKPEIAEAPNKKTKKN